jgi:hypothetical protein
VIVAEMLLRLVDKGIRNDVSWDWGVTRRGDVIVANPDGWAWSNNELTALYWLIVKIPAFTLAEAQAMATPEPLDLSNPGRLYYWKRLFYFNLSSLVVAVPQLSAALAYPRSTQSINVTQTARVTAIRNSKTQRAAIPNPGEL